MGHKSPIIPISLHSAHLVQSTGEETTNPRKSQRIENIILLRILILNKELRHIVR
jgi:hypothetical protein